MAGQEKTGPPPTVEVVIPVYNEERDLARSVEALRAFLQEGLPWAWRILVADNGSTDGTLEVARELAQRYPGEVAWLHLPEKGRGRALRRAWLESNARAVAYMDVDLSTHLRHFPELVRAVLEEGYHIAIGSRLAPGARVHRSLRREAVSRAFNLLRRLLLRSRLRDTQCGFKALRQEVARALLPAVQDNHWFFDTELLALAEHLGLRIKEIPVEWVEDPRSTVRVARTSWEMLKGMLRLRLRGFPRAEMSSIAN